MSGQGPYFGQKAWFQMYHHEKLPSAIERYSNEIVRVIGVVDAHLAKQKTDFLVGDKVTYADLMFIPYFRIVSLFLAPELDLSGHKSYNAWLERLYARPAVARIRAKWEGDLDTVMAKHRSQNEDTSADSK